MSVRALLGGDERDPADEKYTQAKRWTAPWFGWPGLIRSVRVQGGVVVLDMGERVPVAEREYAARHLTKTFGLPVRIT